MHATLARAAAVATEDAPSDVGALFDAHARYVGRALRCLGVDERDVEDAIQEVFLVAHRRHARFEGRASIKTWLYAISVRVAHEHRRREARARGATLVERLENEREAAEHAHRATGPEDELVRLRALERALALLEALDDDKRAVFVLHEVEQLPMSEIASALRCPLQTAYSRLYAARRELSLALKRLRARGGEP